MPRPTGRFNRLIRDGLRSCTTPHGQASSRYLKWSAYPSVAVLPINPGIDVMGQNQKYLAGLDLAQKVYPVLEDNDVRDL